MAFLINICKFNGCGITFPSLGDLIHHIEDTHIDYDPKVIEQKEQAQPACLPLSYVLRFVTDAARKESPFLGSNGVELKRKMAIKHHSYSMSSSNRSNTPTGSELDEDEMVNTESEDSNDSWTTEEFSSEFIMRYGSRHSGSSNGTQGNEKPFACPVPGCKKRYKNVNGIKYHSKNGHKKDGKVRKGYKCHCGKSYKTAQGLKNHASVTHNTSPDNSVSNTVVRSLSPSQSFRSLSPSSISNMSNSNSSCNISNNNNCNIMSVNQIPSLSSLTNTHNSQSNNCNAGNGLMRSNIGLISIKTSKSANLIAANVAANKILKIANNTTSTSTSTSSAITTMENSIGVSGNNSTIESGKLKFDIVTSTSISNKIDLPSLVNLGILTPATSPNKSHSTAFQTPNNVNTNSNSNSIQNHQNNNNLPLTPISPNMQTKTITIATSNKNSTITLNGSGNNCIGSVALNGSVNLITGGGTSGKGIHLSSHGGGINDKLVGEDT